MRIAAVLASHNRRELTVACIGCFIRSAAAADVAFDIVLADSASTDGTVAAVREFYPQTRILELSSAFWWAGAMREAIAVADDGVADFLLWLNDDVMLEEGAVAELLDAHSNALVRNGKQSVIVGAVIDPVSGAVTYSGQKREGEHPLRLVRLHPDGALQACDTFNGNVVLVPTRVSRSLGGIDALFEAVQGMADTDFGYRAKAAGFDVWLAPRPIGRCASNTAVAPWRDGRISFARRLAAIGGPRGYPWRAWSGLLRRYGGKLWWYWTLRTYLRCLGESLVPLEPEPPRRPRVAFVEGLLPAYRIGLFKALESRAALDFDIYFGAGLGQQTPRSIPAGTLGAFAHPRTNRFWPWGKGRIAWSGGSLQALLGRYQAVIGSFHTHDLGMWLLWITRKLAGRPRLLLSGHFRLDSEEETLAQGALSRLHLRFRRRARILMARGADAVLPYTEEGRRSCLKHGVAPEAIFVTHNTLDVAACMRAAAALSLDEVEQVRRQHGIVADRVFLFVGRLYQEKRLDIALEAIARLRTEGHDCQMVIVGDGPQESALRALPGAGGAVFVPPLFTEPELAPFFSMATAQVQPDSAGLAVVHSFAYGVPVVICPGAYHGPEIAYLRHDHNGLVAVSLNGDALADCLRPLMTQEGLARRLSQAATMAATGLTLEKSVEAILDAVRHTLPGSASDGIPAKVREG
ncbi:glycosyltransferase [Radicibacter daui]|uniref:glycosyltransferase n=1 Tax=Radicibacter daui TaxID=3064829 RepID=UPI004046CEBF